MTEAVTIKSSWGEQSESDHRSFPGKRFFGKLRIERPFSFRKGLSLGTRLKCVEGKMHNQQERAEIGEYPSEFLELPI
jgi:hypothetical protein